MRSSSITTTANAQDTISQAVVIKRFDNELHTLLQTDSSTLSTSLQIAYNDFLRAFGSVTINNSEYKKADYYAALKKYYTNPLLSQIYKDALDTFKIVSSYEAELSEANKLIGLYFKDKKLPYLSMHISGFKANTIVMHNLISISTDKYLGADYPQYKDYFAPYQLVQMQPKMITRDYLRAWCLSELPTNTKRKDVLSEMINEGKILYALQLLLPTWSEADLIGYTPDQYTWAKENIKDSWKTTIEQNYLYNTDHMVIVKYMEEAPYTATISTQSPPRLGAWLGWQIIKQYAQNTQASLAQIQEEMDYQKIIKSSKFNP
ncbi:MAG: hypothetical protein RL662_38 [Bacteroidota bacterium]|jgi:hypothetical protein